MNVVLVSGKIIPEEGINHIIGKVEVKDIDQENSLEDMRKLIDCEWVGVSTVELDGTTFDVWYDDEFLLTNKPKIPTMLLPPHDILICGNCLFAKADEEGSTIGLSEKEIETVTRFARLNRYEAIEYVNNIIRNNKAV